MVFKKGNIPWNKGIVDVHKGKNNHMYGRENKWGKHTEQAKKSIGLKNKGIKKPWLAERNRKIKGWKHKPETIKLMKKTRKGISYWTPETAKKVGSILRIHPNKPEKIIEDLMKMRDLPYIFVGNGKFAIETFNPDFINCNGQKKIIELFGDYWHNLPKIKERDIRRLIAYSKYGYKTLIIWEHELKDMESVENRIKEFDGDYHR